MLRLPDATVDLRLATSIKQGRALVARASLVGDISDYETWKTDHIQWVELTAYGLTQLYVGPAERDRFRSATTSRPADEWQAGYARDLECLRAGIDVLVSLRPALDAHEPAAPEETAEPQPADAQRPQGLASRDRRDEEHAPPAAAEPPSDPEVATSDPEVTTSDPEVATSEPAAAEPPSEPEAATSEPEVATSEPEAAERPSEPEEATSEPEVAQPEASEAEAERPSEPEEATSEPQVAEPEASEAAAEPPPEPEEATSEPAKAEPAKAEPEAATPAHAPETWPERRSAVEAAPRPLRVQPPQRLFEVEPEDDRFGEVESPAEAPVEVELAGEPSGGAALVREPVEAPELAHADEEFAQAPDAAAHEVEPERLGKRVFLLHGANEKWKQAIVRLLERAGPYEVTVLHERPSEGRALLEQAAGSGYAIVLLTADEVGTERLAGAAGPLYSPRARQSVVFEMGLLVGVLTPRYVCVLYERGVELPSEVYGLAYLVLDMAETWQSKLLMQLRSAGFDYDVEALASA